MDNASLVLPPRMPLHMLEEITNNFSEDRELGAGAYGTIYMGELRDGEKIAVKVLHSMADIGEFEKEYLNMAFLQHKNIVRLVGHCNETTRDWFRYDGRLVLADMPKQVLCFEYMHKGSLHNYLCDESNGLDWCTRYAIIKGICEGLKYLHEELEPPIYHLDLNPQHILLDEKLVPKITGFICSRFIAGGQSRVTSSTLGTHGYLPPEYINMGIISNKFDIFSLGIIIIKIMTGQEGYIRSHEMSSHQFIENVHGNWSNRLQETSVDEPDSYCKQVKTCAEVALRCMQVDRRKRPTIGAIVNELNETETMGQIANTLRNDDTGSLMEKVHGNWSNRLQETPADESESYCKEVKTCAEIAISCVQVDQHKRPSIGANVNELGETETVGQIANALRNGDTGSSMDKMRSETHHLPLQHLKDITKNFSKERILGRGGFGVVYKGVLPDGNMVAVKKLETMMSSKEQCESSQKQFENEVNLLTGLKHPNIVQLIGYCYEMTHLRIPHEGKYIFSWKIDSLLCLECMPNGSLDKYISDATSGLDWHTRYKIIEGISHGLQYLHEQSDDPIIHLDLKPANILLDVNMLPKITDFGLSRLLDRDQTIHTRITRGTFGYMPPEFVQGIITPMSDIFSLGVIIFELIMGHRAYPDDVEASCGDFTNIELHKWRNMLEKEPGNTNLETNSQQIEKCIQIGLRCVNPDRTKRPTIRNIINMLQGLESTTYQISN